MVHPLRVAEPLAQLWNSARIADNSLADSELTRFRLIRAVSQHADASVCWLRVGFTATRLSSATRDGRAETV